MAKVITDDQFQAEVLDVKDMPVLVDFYADWCGPCQALMPAIEELTKELDGKAKIVKVNVDENNEHAGKYGVMSIPALKIFKGGEVVDEMTGLQQKDAIKEKLEAQM
jgi:thioredoxin 1